MKSYWIHLACEYSACYLSPKVPQAAELEECLQAMIHQVGK